MPVMRIGRNTAWTLLTGAILLVGVLAGCRAFEPETVIVNKAPETYIIGAPVEHGGGYYRFHVYWYGADEDGRVERFVWALTDTTIQDEDTTDDEEDRRFNPALDATTLEIAEWTTRTDSIFNFTIDQGTAPSADFTLHMVAIDDRGAYDRTPARLHFWSNSLGNPSIRFFRVEDGARIPLEAGVADTVGFRRPYEVAWEGNTPNIVGYDSVALARIDTVYPFDDGLFGYKWQLLGDLGELNCTDCWRPRRFNEATGDSFSYFGEVNSLLFRNDGSSLTNPFRKALPSGTVSMLVNSIDLAGVEVADYNRSFSFIVNYDPETLILDGTTDWAHPEDLQEYPYYIRLNDPTRTKVPFQSGDTIPDRTYVVVKALARDDPRDERANENFSIGMAGYVAGARRNLTGGIFPFATETSALDTVPAWGAGVDGWYADTLGFMPGPRTTYTFSMQAIDEHGRRDGTPAELTFDVGYEPCVQCIEFQPRSDIPSGVPSDVACYEPGDTHQCFGDTTAFRVLQGDNAADLTRLQVGQPAFLAIAKGTGFARLVDSADGLEETNYIVPVTTYSMYVLLHGQDDPREAWSNPRYRSMAWRYQVDHECDPFNQIKDGGGVDDIERYTWVERTGQLQIDYATGLWKMRVDVPVPDGLFFGLTPYWFIVQSIASVAGGDIEDARMIWDASLRALGGGEMRLVAVDQTQCVGQRTVRPARYNYFRAVRPSIQNLPAGTTWRDCELRASVSGIKDGLDMSQHAMESNGGTPVSTFFRLHVETNLGEVVDCATPPPGVQ